jgi:hypothetical protein
MSAMPVPAPESRQASLRSSVICECAVIVILFFRKSGLSADDSHIAMQNTAFDAKSSLRPERAYKKSSVPSDDGRCFF